MAGTKHTAGGLSGPELIFAQRMLPHFLAGQSASQAAVAVLADDARLFTAYCDRSHSHYLDLGGGRSVITREGKGDVIAKQITAAVYAGLRAKAEGSSHA